MRAVSQLIAAVALTLFFAGQSAADERSEAIARIDALDGRIVLEVMIDFLNSRAVDCLFDFTPEAFPSEDMPPEMARALFDHADTPQILRSDLETYLAERMLSMDRPEGAKAMIDAQFELVRPKDSGWLMRQRNCQVLGS